MSPDEAPQGGARTVVAACTPEALPYWLRLVLTPTVGPATARKLLARFGLPEQVFAAAHAQPDAVQALVGQRSAAALREIPPEWQAQVERSLQWLGASAHHHCITLADSAYPPELLATEDPPLLLWVQGQLAALAHPRRLAVVGSRNPTPQGVENARHFARSLAQAGVGIVSGLALGIDGAAHEGALEAGAADAADAVGIDAGSGPTLAVVGTGLDTVYPRRHSALAAAIAERGAVVSELLLGTPPIAPNFPKRNRIIAGLAHGTLVVEAALPSGSLITARLAIEQGREVFAIPGSIHATQYKGCHALIRQGAKLVESAQDILEDLKPVWPAGTGGGGSGSGGAGAPGAPTTARPSHSGPHAALLQLLGHEPTDFDTLQARCGLPTPQLQAALLELELEGCVVRQPGGLFLHVVRG